jgi:hypothetical protein
MIQPQSIDINHGEILRAIELEEYIAKRSYTFKILSRERDEKVWKIQIDSEGSQSALLESMEGATAWWPGPPGGSADVLAVIPGEDMLVLRYASGEPPSLGKLIITPPNFLKSLRELWEEPHIVAGSRSWLESIYAQLK